MGLDTFMDLLRKNLSDTDFKRMMAFIGGMEPERRTAMTQFLAERETLAPAIGAEAPDFKLPRLDSTEQVRLSSFRGRKPVALIFGSYTDGRSNPTSATGSHSRNPRRSPHEAKLRRSARSSSSLRFLP